MPKAPPWPYQLAWLPLTVAVTLNPTYALILTLALAFPLALTMG